MSQEKITDNDSIFATSQASHAGKVLEKRKVLKEIHKQCLENSIYYKKRYKRLKRKDDIVDIAHTSLNMSAVALTLSGFGAPPLLIASATCAGLGLVISQAQKTYNSKIKLTNFNVCITQYDELAREITAVLHRNHMSSKDYQEYIEDINAKLSMIDDSRIL
jgi:hypothetical protein